MTLSTRIAPHLPYLRRFSRAVTGSQTSGDAYVAAALEALIADVSIFPQATSDRIALYKLFSKLFSSSAVRIPSPQPHFVWEQRAARNLANLAPRPRQAFLLVAVEGFTNEQAAEILDISDAEFTQLLDQASRENDPAKRQEQYSEVQRILSDDLPVVWLLEMEFPTFLGKRVKNANTTAIGVNDTYESVWLAK